MAVRVYLQVAGILTLTGVQGKTLDSASLQLPAGSYTTMRTYGGMRILGLAKHLSRLLDSQTRVGHHPEALLEEIRDALRQVLTREGLPEARLRVTLPFDGREIYVSLEPFRPYPESFYREGVHCATTHLHRENPACKLTDFIMTAEPARAGLEDDVHELLMLDGAGRILEGLSSNFFCVCDGRLWTAVEDVLDGITRQVVLELAKGLIPIRLEPLDLNRLAGGEAFITSSSREVLPVTRIDGTPVGSGHPGPLTRELMARYRDYCCRAAEEP